MKKHYLYQQKCEHHSGSQRVGQQFSNVLLLCEEANFLYAN